MGPNYFFMNKKSSGSNPVLDIIQIGTPSSSTSDLIPLWTFYEHTRCGMIFDASEIGKAGEIQAIEFAMAGPSSPTSHVSPRNRVYICHWTKTDINGRYEFTNGNVDVDWVSSYQAADYQRTFGAGTGDNVTFAMGRNNPTWIKLDFGGTNLTTLNYNNIDALGIFYETNQQPSGITSQANSVDFPTNAGPSSNDRGCYSYQYGGFPTSMTRVDYRPCVKLHIFG
jgi:hypothetical protein